ncbi:MAG: CapA family protein [Alphaproteobacteria bacterium]|nr:CapA family protein [Alphaproteobacteria bacterium]
MARKSQNPQIADKDIPRTVGSAVRPLAGGPSGQPMSPLEARGEPAPARATVRLGFVGDLMLGRGVDAVAGNRAAEEFWGDLAPLLGDADSVIGNLECPITDTTERWMRCPKSFRFRASPKAIDILKAGNIGGVCLANNHVLDCEVAGLTDTLAHLDRAGIARAGAGKSVRDASRPALFKAGGVTVGMVAVTDTMRPFAAGPDRAGTHYIRIDCDDLTLDPLWRLERDLRHGGADITILSAHWGPNLRPRPPARYRRFARAAIDLGFDVFHGHSAHILQGVEFRNKGLILYDTGDCLDDYWVFPGIRTDRSAVFFVEFGAGGVERLNIVPIFLTPTKVRRARGPEARAIIKKILGLSRPFSAAGPDLNLTLDFSLGTPAKTGTGSVADRAAAQGAARPAIKTGAVQ